MTLLAAFVTLLLPYALLSRTLERTLQRQSNGL